MCNISGLESDRILGIMINQAKKTRITEAALSKLNESLQDPVACFR